MAYSKKTWQTGDLIDAAGLNNMEDGINNLEGALRYDKSQTSLTATQQKQARTNIGIEEGQFIHGDIVEGYAGAFATTIVGPDDSPDVNTRLLPLRKIVSKNTSAGATTVIQEDTWIPYIIPSVPTGAGAYVLKATRATANGTITYEWIQET